MNFKKSPISSMVIILIIITLANNLFIRKPWAEKRIITGDQISYYAYLPASLIYKDLTFGFMDNYKGNHDFVFWPSETKDGNKVIKTTMGISILNLPFFFIGHLQAKLTGYDTGGFTIPYQLGYLLGGYFYFILGLLLLKSVLDRYFNDLIVSLSIGIIYFGTGISNQVFFGSVHGFNFGLFAMFLFFMVRWHDKPTVKESILLGLILGLITLIRPTNGIIILFFLLYNIKNRTSFFEKWQLLTTNWKLLMLLAFFAILPILPQLFYWKSVTGHLLYFSYGEERFYFNNPHISNVLWSYTKGWWVYSPVMVFIIPGIITLYFKKNPYFLPVLIFSIFNVFIIASWWNWWYGGCFGQRAMTDSYPLLIIPIGFFLKWILELRWNSIKISFLSLLFICSMVGQTLVIQYRLGLLHSYAMSKDTYWLAFGRFKEVPYFYHLLKEKRNDFPLIKDKQYCTEDY